MPPANMETDPFFTLLTDALRAGPGSPQWHDAVLALRQQGLEGSDEHRLLIEARENLESGRDYRSVRAGAGFTRKLMNDIENEPVGPRKNGVPTATIVAILCGLLVLGVVVYIIIHWPHEATVQQQIDDLANTKEPRFFGTLEAALFKDSIPPKWNRIGSLNLDASDGLRPNPQAAAENKNPGGGVVWSNTVPGDQAFAVEVLVHVPKPTGAFLLEAFVSADDKFSSDKGTSSKDVVWQLHGLQQQVLVSGSFKIPTTPPVFHDGDTVRLVVDQNVAIVEVGAPGKMQRLWAGPHDLGSGPRFIGVRFLQTGPAEKQDLSVSQIKIITSSPG